MNVSRIDICVLFFFFQAEDGIRDLTVTGVQTCALPILDQISRDLPDLVWLDTMDINAGRINLAGRGLNPNAIALFIENIKNDPYFEEPQVGAVTQVSAVPLVYGFDMNFAFSYAPKNAAPATATDTTGTTAT